MQPPVRDQGALSSSLHPRRPPVGRHRHGPTLRPLDLHDMEHRACIQRACIQSPAEHRRTRLVQSRHRCPVLRHPYLHPKLLERQRLYRAVRGRRMEPLRRSTRRLLLPRWGGSVPTSEAALSYWQGHAHNDGQLSQAPKRAPPIAAGDGEAAATLSAGQNPPCTTLPESSHNLTPPVRGLGRRFV